MERSTEITASALQSRWQAEMSFTRNAAEPASPALPAEGDAKRRGAYLLSNHLANKARSASVMPVALFNGMILLTTTC